MPLLDRGPAEGRTRRDPITGVRIEQWTTTAAHHWLPAAPDTPLTPGGDLLLFFSNRAGGRHPELFRLDLRDGTIEQVTETDRLAAAAITPAANDQQAIASLSDEESEVVAIDLETGEWETLAGFLGAALDGCHRSASGEYIITVVRQEEEATITAVHTQGMRTVPILTGPGDIAAARFSPDSKNSVLYVTETPCAIRCVEFDGTGARELCSGVPESSTSASSTPERQSVQPPEGLNAGSPIWLGSGEEVLFIAGGKEGPLMAVPRRGGSPRELTARPCRWVRSDASGGRLVAVGRSMDSPEARGDAHDVLLLTPRTGEGERLCTGCSRDVRPCFAPDGGSVVYADRDEWGYFQIYRAVLDEAQRRRQ